MPRPEFNGHLVDLEILGDRRHGGGHGEAARGDQDEHQVKHVEHWATQHLDRCVTVRGLARLDLGGYQLRRRHQQQPRNHANDTALYQSEYQERVFVSRRIDHGRNRPDGNGGAGAESGGGNAGGETPPAREPLQGVADAGAVNAAGADAAERGGKIQYGERTRAGIHDPGERHQNAAAKHYPARSEAVDQIAFNRNEPCLDQNKNGERDLNRAASPVILGIYGIDEERPPVL
jgi:hypothetical protein